MIVPVLETVMGFVLCTLCACAAGSSLEMWMMVGNAVRLAMDMGLHLEVRLLTARVGLSDRTPFQPLHAIPVATASSLLMSWQSTTSQQWE